ncbi:Ig domain-containing protein, partial [Mobiluncus curtisii]|uniref:Ig domain-containing protein n=1 Tax=Mobiluncus curtisii TaxID=2051 RepID=UPI0021E2022C
MTLTIPVNDEFTANGPTPPRDNLYVGSKTTDFTPTEGRGDTCYGLDASGACQKAKFTYSASGLPAGLSINPQTGVISGTPTEPVKNREISVTVASNAPGGDAVTQTFMITVASAFSDPENQFHLPSAASSTSLDGNGTVKNDSNQVLSAP